MLDEVGRPLCPEDIMNLPIGEGMSIENENYDMPCCVEASNSQQIRKLPQTCFLQNERAQREVLQTKGSE